MKENEAIKQKHFNRVQQLKLRTAMKSLKSVGLTEEEVIAYIKDRGFETREEDRQENLRRYRKARDAASTRQASLEKARAARHQKAEDKVVKGLEKAGGSAAKQNTAPGISKAKTPARTAKKTPAKQLESLE